MLTLQQAYEVKASIIEYLKATFTFREKDVNTAFEEFIEGMFKGPYVSLRLPFVKADPKEIIPLDIHPDFIPFYHQLEAFKKLSTQNGIPEPTILTTGTGSGKTEAFLYPILDYCYMQRNTKGIKVIILYPMNALATDQAKRLASAIHSDERLKGELTAGLFIGESLDKKKKYPKQMGAENIIEDRDTIVDTTPDILLTNFKMLDLALMQSRYHNLWINNFKNPTLLKFLVLDELHTYEGAQGSDVANLIRRVKLKLEIPNNHLCPVGTSATIGKGEESKSLLADFATKVFGEDFTEDSIIEENRIQLDDFFAGYEQRNFLPTVHMLKKSRLKTGEDFQTYIQNQLDVWGLDKEINPISLSEELKRYQIIKDLLAICSSGIVTVNELLGKLSKQNKEFSALPNWDDSEKFSPQESIIRSILSLISYAKIGNEKKQFPFLYLQVQLWIRELAGFVRKVDDEPKFLWREDIDVSESEKALPVYYCRECGASGWFGVKADNRDNFDNDINDVYTKFFSHHKNLYLLTTYSEDNLCVDEYEPSDAITTHLNRKTLSLNNRPGDNTIKVVAYRKLFNNYNQHICPQCNSVNTINIVGQRVSTLTSVSASQLLATDLDQAVEKHRKLLGFTNGVQDAAHQAGFIEARNYRFTFRTSLQKVINSIGKPIKLSDLHREFIDYWKDNADDEGKNHLEAYYYKFFPSDHAADVAIDRYKNQPNEFLEEFNNRVRWEISTEFGYNAIIGRTLEKTGSSATFFSSDKLEKSYELMKEWLNENALENLKKEDFLKFLIVFLHRLRMRGGVDHIYLNKFRTGRSNYYLITQSVNPHFFLMRNFGKNTRLPKFITDTPNNFRVFDLTTRRRTTNWFHKYYSKAFELQPDNDNLVNEFYTKLLDTLSSEEIGLLDIKEAQGIRNFALVPNEVYVKNDVHIYECNKCGNRISTTSENYAHINQSFCSVYRCTGKYEKVEHGVIENYYQQVYNRGKAPRIYAADHTGLLDRAYREELENDFKSRSKFDSKNVLVATSTLEMGIDIGELNTAINTSIPPLPSNFIQRVGRAGRSSGSAIVVNFAENDAHNLYYFENPLEMMDGEVNTPGCYLEAKEILRRHFFAYCIDQWTKDDPGKNVIPPRIMLLKIDSLDLNDPNFFINHIISFVKQREKSLFQNYKESFKDKVSEEIFDELSVSLKNNHLFEIIKKSFGDLKEEINNLKERRKELNELVKEKNLDETDPEYIELQREYKNIQALIKLIRDRQVIEHLINSGLLPNYAFPEKGVVLKATVSKPREDDPKQYDFKQFEVVRPAISALREFAPDNKFYTQGYKLKISGVNVVSWKDEVVDYRFCSNCDHIQVDIPPVNDNCPKCSNPSWRSTRNVHKVIRMRAVNSFSSEKEAKLDDSSEQREDNYSHITQHFSFNEQSMQGSWVMKKIPFGIEFIKDVSTKELNLGLSNSRVPPNNTVVINNKEVPKAGYIICRVCGKVTTSTFDEKHDPLVAKDYHFGFCKKKQLEYVNQPDDTFEEVFFNRMMDTEAIKILLPVQEFNTESSIKLFKAGIMFGLRKYFRGNPDHISLSEYSEYNQQTQKNDRYLVLYDRIPGGTGYLSKLFDKEEFNKILKEAYINIRDCQCQYDNKDGCYNCIYTYGNQFEREELSRKKAEELFEKIVKSAGEWDYLPGGLGKITNSGKIEESELEERFIQLLSKYYNDKLGNSFREITIDGITKYSLKIDLADDDYITLIITPQVELGPSSGVRYTTIADFLVTCSDAKINGKKIEEPITTFKQIAVYLDGYQYHASAENNRFIQDLEKRKSILDTEKYFIWTLTWKDLDLFEEGLADNIKEIYDHELNKNLNHPLLNNNSNNLAKGKNNLSRFIWLLENYHNDDLREKIARFIFYYQSNYPHNCISESDAQKFIDRPALKFEVISRIQDPNGWIYLDKLPSLDFFESRLLQQLKTIDPLGKIFVNYSKSEYAKDSWEKFWLLFNLLQILYGKVDFVNSKNMQEDEEVDNNISEVLENFEDKYHDLVRDLLDNNINFNKDDYFYLLDDNGSIIAEAFLGLPDQKIVIEPLDENSKQEFEKHSYRVLSLENFDINKI